MNNYLDSDRRRAGLGTLEKYGLLLMGIFLVILSGGRFVTPVAAFLAPIFLLRFMRNSSVRTGTLLLYVLLFLSLLVRLHDYVSVPRPLNLLLIAGIALLEVLPFLADRTLREYLPTFLRPFVLPCMFVVLGFAASAVLPFGTMGEKAYSQFGNSEFMQLLAVTGTHGITFVIFWFAATMASLWGSGFVWQRNRSQVIPLALCLTIIFVSGGFRNIFDENESATVRIAGITGDHATLQQSLRDAGVANDLSGLSVAGYNVEEARKALSIRQQDLLQRSKQQALAGARIVAWAEASAVVFKSNEPEFIAQAASVARENKIYLVASVVITTEAVSEETSNKLPQSPQETLENKLLVFGPNGEQLGQYVKARSLRNEAYIAGEGKPLLIDTPHGKLAFAIGFDLDFPPSIRQAGDADILIAPSADWRTLSPHHSLMSTFRGVENGFSVFRPTSKGLSVASDSHGRILARTDHFRTTPHNFVADIPTGGVSTFYTRAGDWFAWVVCALFLLLLLVALLAARKRKKIMLKAGGPIDPDEVRDRSRITAIQWREAERDNNLHRNNKNK